MIYNFFVMNYNSYFVNLNLFNDEFIKQKTDDKLEHYKNIKIT